MFHVEQTLYFLFVSLFVLFVFMFHVERLPAEFNEQNIDVGR